MEILEIVLIIMMMMLPMKVAKIQQMPIRWGQLLLFATSLQTLQKSHPMPPSQPIRTLSLGIWPPENQIIIYKLGLSCAKLK